MNAQTRAAIAAAIVTKPKKILEPRDAKIVELERRLAALEATPPVKAS